VSTLTTAAASPQPAARRAALVQALDDLEHFAAREDDALARYEEAQADLRAAEERLRETLAACKRGGAA
jgi:hypothetical protein